MRTLKRLYIGLVLLGLVLGSFRPAPVYAKKKVTQIKTLSKAEQMQRGAAENNKRYGTGKDSLRFVRQRNARKGLQNIITIRL